LSTSAEEILAKLVSFDTTSNKPNRACIDYVRAFLSGYGVPSEILADDSGDKANLFATVGSSGTSGIVLAGHTDVVPVDDQKWTSSPFVLAERNGKIYGRGTTDMKGFLACALSMVPEFLAAKTATSFHLALTSDEETDMAGAARLSSALRQRGFKPAWVWLGEPTGLNVIDRHKGASSFVTTFTGVPGHSSLPQNGLNAIELAAQWIDILMDIQQKKKANPFSPSVFDPPYTTVNLGSIRGGTAENIIAETCELVWELRIHPGDDGEALRAEVERLASSQMASRFTALASKARMETRLLSHTPSFQGTEGNAGVKALQFVKKDLRISAAGFATEAGFFQKLGADVVICGPGSVEQAHQPDEFIDKSQLSSCVDLMRQVLLSSTPCTCAKC
jgi:acetylornithine deacetylase